MSIYFNIVSFNWSNLFSMELMFQWPINTLFTLCSITSRIPDKAFREALLMDLLLDWYVKFISVLSNFLKFKLLVLLFMARVGHILFLARVGIIVWQGLGTSLEFGKRFHIKDLWFTYRLTYFLKKVYGKNSLMFYLVWRFQPYTDPDFVRKSQCYCSSAL